MVKKDSNTDTAANKPHFDISAYVVKQLGDELISDEVTAILEFVKNCYDADADYANIEIDTEKELTGYDLHYKDYKGYILIDDNGDGMSKEEITFGWLTISASKKRAMKQAGKATAKGRTPLGEKGLGRLSTQRLASKIELITKNETSPFAYHVSFNWDDFNEETLLSQVNIRIDDIEKSKVEKGTRLILLNLKDPTVWKGDNLERIKAKLSQLISPRKNKRPFKVYLKINGKKIDLDYISDAIKNTAVSRYAYLFYQNNLTLFGTIKLGKLQGNDRSNYSQLINSDNGKGFYDFMNSSKKHSIPGLKYSGEDGVFVKFRKTIPFEDIAKKEMLIIKHNESIPIDNKGNSIEPSNNITKKTTTLNNNLLEIDEEQKVYANPGDFKGKIEEYTFVKDTTDISSLEEIFKEFTQYTTYIQNQSGIRIFRDGFGIRPFGLDGEDWLKLSSQQTSGSSYYGLRPRNVVGFIEIGAKKNPALLEKTDREGFIENMFYKNFYSLNEQVIREINDILEGIKRAYNDYRKKFGIDNTGINNQKAAFGSLQKTAQKAVALGSEVNMLQENIGRTYNAVKAQITKVSKEPLFNSQEDQKLQPLLQDVSKQLDEVKALMEQLTELLSEASKLNHIVHILEPQITTLQDQLAEFSELAGLGMIAETLSHEIDNILDVLISRSVTHLKYLKTKKYDDSTLYVFIEYVNSSIKALRKQTSHLSPSLRYLREEIDTISIKDFTKEMCEFYQEGFEKSNIGLEIIDDGPDYSVSINRGKLMQIFDNIFLNSEYWLKEFMKTRKFKPNITVKINKPFLRIYDNGLGIDPSIEDRVFQPFVSKKPKKVGRGLGLFIVQQLLEANTCDIILLPDRNEHGRRYIYQINFSNILK